MENAEFIVALPIRNDDFLWLKIVYQRLHGRSNRTTLWVFLRSMCGPSHADVLLVSSRVNLSLRNSRCDAHNMLFHYPICSICGDVYLHLGDVFTAHVGSYMPYMEHVAEN